MELPPNVSKWIHRWLFCLVISLLTIIFIAVFISIDNIPLLSPTAGVATFLIALCIVWSGDPGDTEGTLPSRHTPSTESEDEPNESDDGFSFPVIRNRKYRQVVLGFASFAGIFVFLLVWQGGHAQLYLSAAPFYAAIGFYLFSQGNTIYSLAEGRNDFVLFQTADQVTRSAYIIAVAAGGYLLLGVFVSQVDPPLQPLHSRLLSAAAAAIVQGLFFYALRVHRVNHLWFQYVEEQMIADRIQSAVERAESYLE